MAIDFPASPTNGQTFVVGTVTYTWDGVKWTAVAAGGGGGGSGDKIEEGNTSAEVIDTGSDGRFVVTTEGSERLRVTDTGLVGIGTASPTRPLTVAAGSGAGVNILGVFDARSADPLTVSNCLIAFSDPKSTAGQFSARFGSVGNSLAFYTNGATERMRIADLGDLRVYSSNTNGFRVGSSYGAGINENLFAGYYSGASLTAMGNECFVVRTNGNVLNTNNSYGSLSDAKLKENIVDASSQWDDLKALQVRNYNFKEGQTHTQIGLVAQEAEAVSPGLVSESPDRDEDGNDLGTVTKSVNYSVLYMKAVKALQEAMERIETLEAKVAALEGASSHHN